MGLKIIKNTKTKFITLKNANNIYLRAYKYTVKKEKQYGKNYFFHKKQTRNTKHKKSFAVKN
jgi:hypothetical protein